MVISLFSLIAYLVSFNTDKKRHFLTYMLTGMSFSTFPPFNLSMFSNLTEEYGTAIND